MVDVPVFEYHPAHLLQETLIIIASEALRLRVSASESRRQVLAIHEPNIMRLCRNLNGFYFVEIERIVFLCDDLVKQQ